MMSKHKLRTLKSRVQMLSTTTATLLQTATVERKRGSAGVKDRNRVRQRDCGLCQPCRANGRVTPAFIVDHRIPLWAGGSDDDDNKQAICGECHDEKSAREARQRANGG